MNARDVHIRALEAAGFELTARLCAIAVVAEKDGYELIRRESVMEFVTKWRMARDAALSAQQAGQPAPAVPEGWRLMPPITEEMHIAAVKVLHRASGLDGLPQRMVDAMINAAPAQEGNQK